MDNEAIVAASDVMNAHIRALNARDTTALAATLHFPHFRLSGNRLKVWETPASYFDDFLARAGSNWSYSRFEDSQILQSSPDKVHIDVEIRRFDAQGTLITSFRSLWVITQLKGVWAAQFRSSFANQ